MKITPDHYAELKTLLLPGVPKLAGHREYLKTVKVKNLEYRLLWDWLWAANHENKQIWFDKIYKYANDEHITTALKRAYKELIESN